MLVTSRGWKCEVENAMMIFRCVWISINSKLTFVDTFMEEHDASIIAAHKQNHFVKVFCCWSFLQSPEVFGGAEYSETNALPQDSLFVETS